MSSEGASVWMAPLEAIRTSSPSKKAAQIIIDPAKSFQSIVGVGASLEHSTCWNLSQLGSKARSEVIRQIVDPINGNGMNIMRICIGASDFIGEPFYSYDDMPEGETDLELKHFSIEKDRAYVLPVLKEALAINPELLFVASPWSPPAWMKDNGSLKHGRLLRKYYDVYAQYLVKFIEAYQAEGIPIYAITPQNEPDYPNKYYPTCYWSAEDQRDFIRDFLGPQLRKADLTTPIWCWDHNWNLLEFPDTVLRDEKAAQYVYGTAFHLYEGKAEAQTTFKKKFPEKDIFFTEGSTFKTDGAIEIIKIFRNWSRTYQAWVLFLDENQKPNNGPHDATPTSIERLADNSVRYNFDHFMYGHFSRFIQRGAVRIDSSAGDNNYANLVVRNPDGSMVMVVANAGPQKSFRVRCGEMEFEDVIEMKTVATYRWKFE
ncbi:MAG: glycoside hydrolase family 30 beta sandwich domain-containing protein [Candidatus Hinthialibacter antarcticus]|nr:glycoside hydrolase family 30 beta sandwich domain-containing protein [Candidatus Hinthialibacter antarcticus]